MQRKTCPYDTAYLLDHLYLVGWKKCTLCAYAEDSEGYNALNPKPKDGKNGNLNERNSDGSSETDGSRCGDTEEP